ncbi:MAG: cytochrome P450 [Sphingomonadales bacterium]|nr:cytochrome P450 [Sphingomonadales bacterium]MDE2568949.1 cytochrome P450 [Sphingomonadales bacterium]
MATAALAPRPDHVPADRVVDLDIYAPPGLEEDYHRAWARAQAGNPPLVWTPRNEGHWVALGGEVLAEVQSDWERFSNRVIVLPKSIGEMHGLIPTTIDPPEHRPYRKLLNDNLKPSAVRGLHDRIRTVAIDLIEGFRAKGHCNFTEEYARVFPIRIFLAMVDLPESDAPNIRLWAESMTRPEPAMPFDKARQAFFDYLDPIIRERAAAPGEDMLSAMITADMGGRRLNHDEALALCTQVLIAGVDTVVNFLGFVMQELARNPAMREALHTHPAGTLAAAHELFRRFGLVTIAREVRKDIVFHGVELKAGDMVAIPTAIHGLDAQVNADPLAVDFGRRNPRHSAFGSGPHMCPGQELARSEVAITLEEWLARIPDFEIAPDSDLTNQPGIVGSVARLCLRWRT